MRPADLIDRARGALKLTLLEFAALLGVDPSTVTRWRNGARALPNPVALLLRLILEDPLARERVLGAPQREATEPARPVTAPARAAEPRVDRPPSELQNELLCRLKYFTPSKALSLRVARQPFEGDWTREEQDREILDLERRGLVVLEAGDAAEAGEAIATADRGRLSVVRLAAA
jgi:transcriptional regulator with XRE-family HTH domain